MSIDGTHANESASRLLRDTVGIVVVGLVLAVAYNFIGLQSRPSWGLAWIAEDRIEALAAMETVSAEGGESAAPSEYFTSSNDPLAVPATAAGASALPQIPEVGRPVEIELVALKQYVDARAALLVDARTPDEFAEGHLPGAINLPFDEVVTDPVRLEGLETGGRPLITYCGGGMCEQSLDLAYELFGAGHSPVAVYMGGFPEWEDAGYPVDRGTGRP